MKKRGLFVWIQMVTVILFASSSATAADWRFPVGVTYPSGLEDVVDIYDDNLEAEGYTVNRKRYPVPIGISFHPYVQFDNGFRIGGGRLL